MVKWFLAFFRLNQKAICSMSNKDEQYHDYPDSVEPYNTSAMHGYTYTCRHCKKRFTI